MRLRGRGLRALAAALIGVSVIKLECRLGVAVGSQASPNSGSDAVFSVEDFHDGLDPLLSRIFSRSLPHVVQPPR